MNFGIIAAGKGSRLAAEGVEMAKPMVMLGGKTLLERLTGIFAACGAERIRVIVNGEDAATLAHAMELEKKSGGVVEVIVKSTPDSMHSFAEVCRGFKGKFCVTTVDTVFDPAAFERYIRTFENDDATDGAMGVTSYIDDEKPLYVAIDSDMRISAFCDSATEGCSYVSAGVYGLKDSALQVLGRCLADGTSRMRNFQRALIAGGLQLKAVDLGAVVDIDHAADIATAERLLENKKT